MMETKRNMASVKTGMLKNITKREWLLVCIEYRPLIMARRLLLSVSSTYNASDVSQDQKQRKVIAQMVGLI